MAAMHGTHAVVSWAVGIRLAASAECNGCRVGAQPGPSRLRSQRSSSPINAVISRIAGVIITRLGGAEGCEFMRTPVKTAKTPARWKGVSGWWKSRELRPMVKSLPGK